jgi:hypothetical protein
MNPTRSDKWKFIIIATAIARRSESRVPPLHYNHCHDWFSTVHRFGQVSWRSNTGHETMIKVGSSIS